MATITIDAAAGKFDFDVSDFSLKTILDASSELVDTELNVGDKTATGWLSFSTGVKGQVITVDGTFISKGIFSDGPAHAVKEIDDATIAKGKTTLVTMTDLGLTGDDLKTNAAFDDYLDSQHYTIKGNDFDNILTGGGSSDTLVGGGGDDTYNYGAGDKIVEGKGAAGGFDTIVSSFTINLAKFANVEAVTLTGDANIDATGSNAADTLTGNDGNNILDGGKGTDRMVGGNGDDTYVVDNARDVVVETGKHDHDTIDATVSIDLSKMKTIEDVSLSGKQDLDITGNAAANHLTGNSGDNTLWGGKGNDTLTGGAGSDTFEFHKGDKFDTIADFDAAGKDHDILDLEGFGKLKFSDIDIEKVGKADYEISFGHGDTLHIHLDHSSIKDVDASDFHF
jgi:Ca2+-binding RTX toxin-like protein